MTILFKSDWFDAQGKPRAVIHSTTKNKSFVRMAIHLKKMGIDNNLFHLSLYDNTLLNVDPHTLNDENDPTRNLRRRVAIECKRNVWYYLREVLKISVSGDEDGILFQLHRGNLSMTWCFLCHLDYNSTQPRQTGKSIGAIALTSWVIYISGVNMNVSMLTMVSSLVQENVKRLKQMRNSLPSYLVAKSILDVDNKEGLDYKALNNTYRTYVGQKDRYQANRVGRGSTAPFIHLDEGPFVPNIHITFPAIMASTDRARVMAAKFGQMRSNLYTTTAGDPSTEEGKFVLDMLNDALPFTEKLYDRPSYDDLHDFVKKNSIKKLINGTFSYLQLGYTHEWFHETIARNNVSPDKVQRDYLNNWISMADTPIIPEAVRLRMTSSRMHDPYFIDIINEYIINWYIPKEIAQSAAFKSKSLILGMDSSEMVDRDFTGLVCIDPVDFSVVFTFRCNDANTTKIALFIARLMSTYPKMLFVPERKSSGTSIIDTVIISLQKENMNPFTRIFNRIIDDYDKAEFASINIHDAHLADTTMRKYLGFMTTGSSRTHLYKETLQRAAMLAADKIRDPVIISEMCGLQAKNGRIDHRAGAHDDLCISFLLAAYVILSGKNLHLYGIDVSKILQNIDVNNGDTVDTQYIQAQIALKKQLKDIEKQITSASNSVIKQHFILQHKRLSEYVDHSISIDPISVESVRQDYGQFHDLYRQSGDVMKPKKQFTPQQVYAALYGGAA